MISVVYKYLFINFLYYDYLLKKNQSVKTDDKGKVADRIISILKQKHRLKYEKSEVGEVNKTLPEANVPVHWIL